MGVGHCRRHSEQDDKSINTDARAEVCSTKRCPKRARTLSRKMLVAPLQSTADSSNYLLELELKIVEKMHVTKGPEHCPRHVTPCSGSLVTSTDIKIPPPNLFLPRKVSCPGRILKQPSTQIHGTLSIVLPTTHTSLQNTHGFPFPVGHLLLKLSITLFVCVVAIIGSSHCTGPPRLLVHHNGGPERLLLRCGTERGDNHFG